MKIIQAFAKMTAREQKFIFGLLVFFVISGALYGWSHLQDYKGRLRENIANQIELIAWIEQNQTALLSARSPQSLDTSKSVFVLVEQAFGKINNEQSKAEIRSLAEDKVSVSFNRVLFSELMATIGSLNQQKIQIDRFHAKRLPEQGWVSVALVLSR